MARQPDDGDAGCGQDAEIPRRDASELEAAFSLSKVGIQDGESPQFSH